MKTFETRPQGLRRRPLCGARTRSGPCTHPALPGRTRRRSRGGLSPEAPKEAKNGARSAIASRICNESPAGARAIVDGSSARMLLQVHYFSLANVAKPGVQDPPYGKI